MTDMQKTLYVLNALLLKTQGALEVRLVKEVEGMAPTLRVSMETEGTRPVYSTGTYSTYTTVDWKTVEKAAEDLDVTYAIFSTDAGLKASVTKDIDGTQVRLVFAIEHNGTETAVILNRILELYVRTQLWELNPKQPISGYGKMHDELFGCVD